jgi:isoamylase
MTLIEETPGSPLEVHYRGARPEAVIELAGCLDGTLPHAVRTEVLSNVKPGCHLRLDVSKLTAVSGAGVRMLLMLFRGVRAAGGTISAEGLSPELLDLAEAAGLLDLFRADAPTVACPISPPPVRQRIDAYPTHQYHGYALRAGSPLPFGATQVARGINFSVYSAHATACTLVLFEAGECGPLVEIPFPPEFRSGNVWAMTVFDLEADALEYGFRMDGPWAPERGLRFDRSQVLLDPTVGSIRGREVWGHAPRSQDGHSLRGRMVAQDFDWEGDRPLGLPIEDLIIYEMHVRGFTASRTSGVRHRGTYAGLREKIPYLKSLGVNCVELLPIFEFDELENPRQNPLSGDRLWNYWGYSTVGFFAPKAGYAATGRFDLQVDEFKTLVKELHKNGIEVLLDVVFNHTAEGNEAGPTLSFRGLDNRTYYMLAPDGSYLNFSGCGNTFNCNHPVVRAFVVDCLRHWVIDYHIDGFRFDLASVMGRDQNGVPLMNPPLLESLAADPVLATTKLIAEAWDAGGLYQVGSFPAYGRWAEWNGRYRDCVRKFLRGDFGQVGEMAARVVGSPDLYAGRGATASINFVTCHDGFTLADLVSYNEKHNEANGENNEDGANDNNSWNCGREGPTDDTSVNALRLRQMKNAMTMLMVSQGVPMIQMGDECGRTQHGNNNAYCHDGPLVWFDWTLPEQNAELWRFVERMIRFRRAHPALRSPLHPGTPGAPEVIWHGTRAWHADWSPWGRTLAFQRVMPVAARLDNVYVAMNMYSEALEFELPAPSAGERWHRFVNSSGAAPEDIAEPGAEPVLADQARVTLGGHAVLVLVAR